MGRVAVDFGEVPWRPRPRDVRPLGFKEARPEMRIISSLLKAFGVILLLIIGTIVGLQLIYRDREAHQNFRITVGDDRGRQLATAVWRLSAHRRYGYKSDSGEGFSGEAIALDHPTLGKLYVINHYRGGTGPSVGARLIRDAYEKIGVLPKNSSTECSLLLLNCPSYISKMKRARAPLEQKGTPMVVRFRNEADPKSIELLTTQYADGGSEVELRFFVQATSDPVTCGVAKHLPWLATYESDIPFVAGDKWHKLTGGYGRTNHQRTELPGPTNSALDWVRKSDFVWSGCSKQ